MAYYFITASKDATIYLQAPDQNTGLDPILEVGKIYYGNIEDIHRSLIEFELTELSQSISSGDVSLEEARLLLEEADSEGLPLQFSLDILPVSGSWQMGSGRRYDSFSATGVTWNYREGISQDQWYGSTEFTHPITGSYAGIGGVFYSEPKVSQSFEYLASNVNVDVLPIISEWLSGSIHNNGFLIKFPDSLEQDVNDYGVLKFFSKETNTIHQPKLRIGWDSQVYQTGSNLVIEQPDIRITPKYSVDRVRLGDKIRIVISVAKKYPQRTFSSTFSTSNIGILPRDSYYQIRDFESGKIIIPFSTFSKINASEIGSYIDLDFSNWEGGRTYSIDLKIDHASNPSLVIERWITFRINI